MTIVNTNPSDYYLPTDQDYPRFWNADLIENNYFTIIPQISTSTTKWSSKSIAIQVAGGLFVFIIACGVIAAPLSKALTVSQTSNNDTTSTTATTVATTTGTTTVTTTTITAVLTVSGPQLNFNPSTLTAAWSLCYSALYSVPMYPNISSILSTCYKNKLLLGCRPVGNTLLTVAAMGNRADVLYNTSASSTTTHQANGVGWYFSMDIGNWNSWGFVLGSNSLVRNNCDGDMSTNPAYRLCWHMIGTAGGWRCGSTGNLDTSTSWEKVIYHAM